jgi:phosphoribosylamine--glycine ligase
MNILIIGSGGREHALAWKLAQSAKVTQVWVAPGNPGTAQTAKCSNVNIGAEDLASLLAFAQQNQVDLTIVGPEVPLSLGIVDDFQDAGLKIFGPSQAAAQLECSKAFSKQMMRACGVPTADFAVFEDYEKAIKFVHNLPFRAQGRAAPGCVVKADGLAAGKGVFVCDDLVEAEEALTRIMVGNEFGESGARVVIEERLSGREVSALAFVDGRNVVMMPPARDHKRVGDGDTGPNTGGMGAFAPASDVSSALMDEVRRTVIQPIVDGMAVRRTPYVGVLYAGLMLITPSPANSDSRGRVGVGAGLRTLEFNCRFGDPETQVLLPLLQSDLAEMMLACVEGKLDQLNVQWHKAVCATVVLASAGYPGAYAKGLPISGLEDLPNDAIAFHAGTARRDGQKDGQVVTAGGRVLAVSATSGDLTNALQKSYAAIQHIQFEGMHYRTDIGQTIQENT